MLNCVWIAGNDGTVVVVIYVNKKYLGGDPVSISNMLARYPQNNAKTYLNMTIPRIVCFRILDQFRGSRGSAVGCGCSLKPSLVTWGLLTWLSPMRVVLVGIETLPSFTLFEASVMMGSFVPDIDFCFSSMVGIALFRHRAYGYQANTT